MGQPTNNSTTIAISKQTIFELVCNHFAKQQRPSMSISAAGNAFCYYRHPLDPTIQCGVGCLIPDRLYQPDFERNSVNALAGKVVSDSPETAQLNRLNRNIELLTNIQSCHDNSYNLTQLKLNLTNIAKDFNIRSYTKAINKIERWEVPTA